MNAHIWAGQNLHLRIMQDQGASLLRVTLQNGELQIKYAIMWDRTVSAILKLCGNVGLTRF